MTAYVQLLSGLIYEYEAEFVLELLLSLAKDLGVSHHNIKLFYLESRVFQSDSVVEGETYYAFIEEPPVVERIYTRVEGDVIHYDQEKYLDGGNAYEVVVCLDQFTPDIIEKMKLDLWEDGHETHSMRLTNLIKLYTEKVKNKKVVRVLSAM